MYLVQRATKAPVLSHRDIDRLRHCGILSDLSANLVELRYTGNLPSLPDTGLKQDMVEEQSFVRGLTEYLSGLHADRVERSAKGDDCEIKLLFRL